ncbi:LuxR C-terminal-related transcriptional regulator [Anaerovorax odorimutans]|uniref:LuxR C-terminal-related transcriptional regulator n=1 Tax=Anaerovorax odorimutans TaxID=109327 RepID=UPI000417E75C|nr:LuxR C-terminal-related transcriptional regulator [Anaerovorax odorimutans]
MQGEKNETKHIIYFSKKLNQRMKQLIDYPCTLVIAPMGYGKTTFISEAMNRINDADIVWQKIYDKTESDFWAGFYQAVGEIDGECARTLSEIGMFEGRFMKREFMSVLESLHIVKKTFLIIDDYHFVKSKIADEFLSILISHMPQNLHLIIITRNALPGARELQLKGYLSVIGSKDLTLSKEDIKHYYYIQGIKLEDQQLQQLYRFSEGWISALYLFMMDYRMHGNFVFTSSVSELVYQTIYEPLNNEMKDFLLAICQFDVFSLKQAQSLWKKENTEELLKQLLYSNVFITREDILGRYSFHNIFRLCLREEFEKLPMGIQKKMWRNTGDAMIEEGQLISAMECFYYAGYFDGVMEMLGTDNPRDLRNEHKELLLCCYEACPMEVKIKYPLSILSFCMDMTTRFREPERFARGCQDFEIDIQANFRITDDERDQLLGEYQLILSYNAYNNLIKMRQHHEKAFALLREPPRFIHMKNTFTFGAPSILYLYYRESGNLENLIALVNKVPGSYAKCTRGHGQGYASVFRGEFMYYQDDYNNAEIAALEGISLARAQQQGDIELCGLFLLAKIALCRGQGTRLMELINEIEVLARCEAKESRTYWLLYAMDLCKGFLYGELERPEQITEWIVENEYEKHLIFNSIAYANIIYGKNLLLKGEYSKILGLAECFQRQALELPNLLALVYTYIYQSAANAGLFRSTDAEKALICALDISSPDNLILPFVENGKYIMAVLERISGKGRYTHLIEKIKQSYAAYRKSVEAIKAEIFVSEMPSFTPRERQIGLLAVEGLNNREIAEKLYISTNTVKAEMKNLFAKLSINSRILLKKEMFN